MKKITLFILFVIIALSAWYFKVQKDTLTVRPPINPADFLTTYTDVDFKFSFKYPHSVEVGDNCGFEKNTVIKQVSISSKDSRDQYASLLVCMYVSGDKVDIVNATQEQVTLSGKEVTRFRISLAGSDEYLYVIPLPESMLYIKVDRSYVEGKSLRFEDTPLFEHFLELSRIVQGILGSVELPK